MIFLSSFCNLS